MTATLYDNPSARDLATLLPLNLTIEDYGSNEKIADLPRKLTEDDSGPFGNERPGDLCYFKPWGNLAMFYADYRWDGLIRLGRFEPLRVRGKFPLRIERIRSESNPCVFEMSGLMRIPASACYQVQTQGFWDRQSKHMSDLVTRIVGFMSRTSKGLRSLRSLRNAQVRLQASTRQAELEGLQFAFYARLTAIIVVSIWLIWLVPWPRDLYYGTYAFGFFLLGYIPYRLRHHRHGEAIKLGFIVLDVALVTAAILVPPPASLGNDWPIQTRLRGQEFLYVLLLLGEAALTYSPRRVLWTGVSILVIWSIGVFTIYSQPDTLRFNDVAAEGALTSAAVLDLSFKPAFVGLTAWYTQLVATSLFTLLITLAVWRSRRTLLNQVQAELVRADLARYVSPDVAEALSSRGGTAFGEPATRTVAVLFADIVGFTKLTEPLSPERTFALLRSFQERSCAIVFRHGGTLDKYLGDGFMATFGSIGLQPDAPGRALACAFELQQEIERWSRKRSIRGANPLRVSVGVHCGPVTVGNLGGRERIEFTVVGDVVNVASRLEEITRAVGGSIIASEDCIRAAGDPEWLTRFHSSRQVQLRGRKQGLLVHIAT